MKPVLIDTDILSLFFRNDLTVIEHFREYLQEHGGMDISILTFYEILSGLKHRDALKQLDDIDILIAGVALAHDLVLVTHNVHHFTRIEDLEVIDWCTS